MSSRARGYLGSKGGAGVWQRIGREVPSCDVLVSAFAGHCALLTSLLPAAQHRFAIDRDPEVVAWWREQYPEITAVCLDSLAWLESLADGTWGTFSTCLLQSVSSTLETCSTAIGDRAVIYLDPPYLLSTRTDAGSRYRCDLTDEDHVRLLHAIRRLPCCVLISGYRSPLYDELLHDWRRIDFTAMTRGGPRVESLWSNRPTPAVPHDQRLLGTDRRRREVLARRDRRLTARVLKLPIAERLRLLAAIASTLPPEAATPLSCFPSAATPLPATLEPVTVRGPAVGELLAAETVSPRGDGKKQTVMGPQVGDVSELTRGTVLSLFSGIGLLDLAFRRNGFTVVSAGDLIFGQDIREFHPQLGQFWGVIGGPPCQQFSRANRSADPRDETGDGFAMLAEFRRVVEAAQPEWWLAENVECVPDLVIEGYTWQRTPVDLTWFVPVRRRRHIQFGSRSGRLIDLTPPSPLPEWPDGVAECVVAGRRDGRDWRQKAALMGLADDWDVPCLRRDALAHAIGNGVPLPIGEFLAASVAATYSDGADGGSEISNLRSQISDPKLCACPCARPVSGRRTYYETNCRQIAKTRRDAVAQSLRD